MKRALVLSWKGKVDGILRWEARPWRVYGLTQLFSGILFLYLALSEAGVGPEHNTTKAIVWGICALLAFSMGLPALRCKYLFSIDPSDGQTVLTRDWPFEEITSVTRPTEDIQGFDGQLARGNRARITLVWREPEAETLRLFMPSSDLPLVLRLLDRQGPAEPQTDS